MAEGIKLFEELKSGSYQAAIFGSYNVHFPFFEDVVLRALRSRGCDHNVLLMDAAQCAQSLGDEEIVPRLAGRLYTLVPVAVPGAFHAKYALLLGKRQSKLLLGSHNLTLSGFGVNREISNVVTIHDRATEALGQAVFQFALGWAGTVMDEVADLVDAACNWAPWLRTPAQPDADVTVIGAQPGGQCLWEQLRVKLDGPVERITVVGPYFDRRLQFIDTLRVEHPEAELIVGISPKHSELDVGTAKRSSGVVFKDLSGWHGDDVNRLIHGKVLYIQLRSGESLLVSGSANPSAPAWLDVNYRNAELVLARRLRKGDPLPEQLGLGSIRECPEMSEAAWQALDNRPMLDDVAVDGRKRVWLALATERGFSIDASFADVGDLVGVLDRDGGNLTRAQSQMDGTRRLVPLEDEELRVRAACLEAEHRDGIRMAVVQHLRELQDRATSKKHQTLRKALMDLDAGEDGIESYMEIIAKAIFDEEPVPRPQRERGTGENKPTTAAEGSAGIGELVNKGRRKPRSSTGDIGLVLDALIYKLGEGLLGDAPVAPRMSEEQIDETTETPVKVFPRDEERMMGHRCRLKTRRLMDRMVKRLDLAWNAKAEPFAVVTQLVACLGLLHRLRQRQPRFAWLRRGESLIDHDALWELFKKSSVVAFAPADGLIGAVQDKYGESSEVASAAALVVWAAWLTGLDVTTAMSRKPMEENDQEESLAGASLLLSCLHSEIMPQEEELEHLFGESGRISPRANVV